MQAQKMVDTTFQVSKHPSCPATNNLMVVLCLFRVHWGFGGVVKGERPAENLCLQISV